MVRVWCVNSKVRGDGGVCANIKLVRGGGVVCVSTLKFGGSGGGVVCVNIKLVGGGGGGVMCQH